MDMFIVRGGRALTGSVRVGGSKNAALPVLAASLLAEGETIVRGVPDLVDVRTMRDLLGTLGVEAVADQTGTTRLRVVDLAPHVADYELVRRMRASVCVLGPLLAKRGRARVSLPGGCNIGTRPIDLHLKGLRALGAEFHIDRGYVVGTSPDGGTRRLVGANVHLGGPFGSTVTGTANVMMAACLAEGVTTIESAAREPEIVDLGRALIGMGARIEGLGTPLLRIEGVETLTGCEHTLVPDRIEAATLMAAATITRGRIELENVPVGDLGAVIGKLREIGVRIEDMGSPLSLGGEGRGEGAAVSRRPVRESIDLHAPPHPSPLPEGRGSLVCDFVAPSLSTVTIDAAEQRLNPADCLALPYPGLPTDVQAQLTALLSTVPGISVVTDKVFPDRFLHVPELGRLGARIRREGASVIVSGVERLSGASVMASDLRASAALVLAALAAEGETVVRRIYHLDRGYESLEAKLTSLGADVRRVIDVPENVPADLRLDRAA